MRVGIMTGVVGRKKRGNGNEVGRKIKKIPLLFPFVFRGGEH